MVVPDEGRPGVHEHEGALGQVAPPRTVEPAGPMARLPPLLVEQPVELGARSRVAPRPWATRPRNSV